MSVYVLPYNSTQQLSKHINARELKCKCYGTHTITVNTELIDKVENLISKIAEIKGTSPENVYINISSANRCKQRDVSVGGNGYGMHTLGKALDFQLTFNGVSIDNKLIACVAQELGFNGIGRIQSYGNFIHCDVGTLAEHGGRKWLGDETIKGGTNGSVINEPQTYWDYYGLKRSDYIKTATPTPATYTDINKQLQAILNNKGAKLAVDGQIGNLTLGVLRTYTIEPCDSGELTKWVQTKLKSIGYDVVINGVADTKTMSAIHKFQTDNKLGEGKFLCGGDWSILTRK